MASTRTSLFPVDDVADVVRDKIDQSISAVVRKMGGDDAFEQRPHVPGSQFTLSTPSARYAIEAARMLRNAADGRIRRYVDEARAEGLSWEEVGGLLGITEDQEDLCGPTPGEQAYDLMATGDRFNRSCSWRCRTCSQLVMDRGPYNPHPVDREKGHAADCARFRADLAAWEARNQDAWGDD